MSLNFTIVAESDMCGPDSSPSGPHFPLDILIDSLLMHMRYLFSFHD